MIRNYPSHTISFAFTNIVPTEQESTYRHTFLFTDFKPSRTNTSTISTDVFDILHSKMHIDHYVNIAWLGMHLWDIRERTSAVPRRHSDCLTRTSVHHSLQFVRLFGSGNARRMHECEKDATADLIKFCIATSYREC